MSISMAVTRREDGGREVAFGPAPAAAVLDDAALERERADHEEGQRREAERRAHVAQAAADKAQRVRELQSKRADLGRQAAAAKRDLENLRGRRARVVAGIDAGDPAALGAEIAAASDAYDALDAAIDALDVALSNLGKPSGQHRVFFLGGNA